jgi:hypothetical protein
LKRKYILLSVLFCSILFGGIAYSFSPNMFPINAHERIESIGVDIFADASLNQTLSEISWGTMRPGENRTATAWVKNTGQGTIYLIMWVQDWNPEAAQDWISLTWDYDSSIINEGSAVQVTFALSVDPGISNVTDFGHTIVVAGV